MDENQHNNTNQTPNARVTSIVRNVANGLGPQSPFLLNQPNAIGLKKERKSFLARDERTLEKLLSLTKMGADGTNVSATVNAKGQYVFTATEKPNVRIVFVFLLSSILFNIECIFLFYYLGAETSFRHRYQ